MPTGASGSTIADATGPLFQAHALRERGCRHHAARRFDDAMAGYQRAAVLYRGLPDHYGEARQLLAGFEDERANALDRRIRSLPPESPGRT